MSNLKYRADIDGLRAIAVLAVVLFHITGATGGYVGVDVFFVISGYLITGIIFREMDRKTFTIADFYARRIRRIIPALTVVVLTTLAVFSLFYVPVDFKILAQSAGATFAFISNIFFLMKNNYFDPSSEIAPLLHTWSLGVEEQYYLFFPLFAVAISRFGRRGRLIALSIAMLLSLALCLYFVRIDANLAFYLPFFRFWELLFGAILAVAGTRPIASATVANMCAAAGLFLIVFCVVVYTPGMTFPAENAILPCLGAVLLIYAGQSPNLVSQKILSLRPVVFVGQISYSLYLWHWPVIVAARYILFREMHIGEQIVALVVMFVLAWLSWRFVEQPFRSTQTVSRRQLFAGTAFIAVVIFAFAGGAQLTGGFPVRFSEPARSYAAAATDINPRRGECDRPSVERIDSDGVCTIGDEKAALSFIMIGDSFSEALMPAMDAVARMRGERGYIIPYSGCFPLARVDQGNPECQEAMDRAIAFAQRHPELHRVILVSRWSAGYFGNRFGQFSGKWFLTDEASTEKNDAETKRVFARSFLRTLKAFEEREIVVIGFIPEQRYDVPRALALNALYGQPASVALPRTLHEERQGPLRRVFSDAQRERPFHLVDLGASLCETGACQVLSDGIVVYADDNHISRKGGIHLAPSIAGKLP